MDILKYVILRLLAFVVPFVGVYWLLGNFIVSIVIAAAIGLMLSYLFLGRYRAAFVQRIAKNVQDRDEGAAGADDDDMHAEDAVVESAEKAEK